jgi:two-component system, LytTR family, response regulator
MITAYVVDDEPLAVLRLTRLLNATGRVEVVGSTTDPETALEWLRTHAVDVVFLDVQMPVLSGFDLLARLDSGVPVIFTTAYDRYALEAFDVSSIDYLLKPVEPARLARALDRVERTRSQDAPDVQKLARALAAQLSAGRSPSASSFLQRVASKVGERTTVLDVGRITHFFSKDKLTFAAAAGRAHVIDRSLAELEQRLDARRFVRIHRAAIVNLGYVQELFPGVDGVIVRLRDEQRTELAVARDRVRDLRAKLGI